MERRRYIYWALPLFVLLSCGQIVSMPGAYLGEIAALLAPLLLILVAWGVVWLRMYSMKLRPEFAILSVLPFAIYFFSGFMGTNVFKESPVWQNLYAITWLAFAATMICTMRHSASCDGGSALPAGKDAVFLLMIPLTLLFSAHTFFIYYTRLTTA